MLGVDIEKEVFDRYFQSLCPIPLKKVSAWKFQTSANGGLGVSIFGASGGFVQLISPSGSLINYYYAGAGAGWSIGGKLPKIPKLPTVDLKGKSFNASSVDFESHGTIHITETFKGEELTSDDLAGPCAYVDAGGGIGAGVGATLFLLGISPLKIATLATGLVAPVGSLLVSDVMSSAKAVVLIGGNNAGIQLGAGVLANLGYFHCAGQDDGKKGYGPAITFPRIEEGTPSIYASKEEWARFREKQAADKALGKAR